MKRSFSIITPIYAYTQEKADELLRCIESIKNQNYDKQNIQHIIVNDGSVFPLSIPDYPWITVVTQANMQRITAYNNGFKRAVNDIICMLDADDEYVPEFCTTINGYFNDNPRYKMFNFGCTYVHKDGARTQRDSFTPKRKKVGHEVFGGGNIVNGTFVFHKDVYRKLGAFPENEIKNVDCTELNYPAGGNMVRDLTIASPYDFSAWFQLEFPETREFFMVHVDDQEWKIIKEVGNPFGQDYVLFYKYTRKFHSKPMHDYLEVVHIR